MRDREPPRFFLDRGLNAESIASRLRDHGFDCTTMDDMYGREKSKSLPDPVWIREATEAGMILLHKDKRVRYRAIEKAALMDSEARSFAIANGNITGAEIVKRFVDNLPAILRAVRRRPRPFFYHVHADRIDPMNLK